MNGYLYITNKIDTQLTWLDANYMFQRMCVYVGALKET